MAQTLLEMTKELVLAQIQIKQVAPESLNSVLHSTYETLRSLHHAETNGSNGVGDAEASGPVSTDWKSSITRHSIRCLECGETFKQLSLRHLRIHDLDPRSYRVKYNIPRTQSLSARDVTARRRELAQQIRPWELAPAKQADAPAAKSKAGAGKRTPAKKAAAKA